MLAGVTARTLHHYDRLGLLKPRRTNAGYRQYEDRDLERLEQIVALKFLGLPLKQIRTVLESGSLKLSDALRMQRQLLEQKRCMLDRAIQAISEAQAHSGPEALRKIIGVIEMESRNDWMDQYQTEESKAKIEARKHLWNPALQEQVSRQWSELIAEVEGALDEDPAGPKAQALAGRWRELVRGFTGGDPAITETVSKMWKDRDNWPKDIDRQAPRIKPEVFSFIGKAMAISGGV